MDKPELSNMDSHNEEIIVRADEVDDTGADVSVISGVTEEEMTSQVEERRKDMNDIGSPTSHSQKGSGHPSESTEIRPILQREGSIPPPPPPKQPPPPAPAREEIGGMSADSLSLAQLKNIMFNYHGMEPVAYAYTYTDTRTFAEELEEWFQYTVEDRSILRGMRTSFEGYVSEEPELEDSRDLLEWTMEGRKQLIERLMEELRSEEFGVSSRALEVLGYLTLGAWASSFSDTERPSKSEEADFDAPNDRFKKSISHIHFIRDLALQLSECRAVEAVWKMFRKTCEQPEIDTQPKGRQKHVKTIDSRVVINKQRDMCLTILYIVIESGRWRLAHDKDESIRKSFISLEPGLLNYMCKQIARVRWDEDFDLQLTRAIQVLWKGMLLILGSTDDLVGSKKALSNTADKAADTKSESILTTSPLDYHMFRQEVISKYPAYNPPPPLLPLEPENTSILPPIPRSTRSDSHSSMNVTPAKFNKSIFEQPVHITTPIPSPPPSPAGPGGKGGKKQNYQTNQNFPFLYPPLDSSSNDFGGKGGVALQDKLVGQKWQGGDVPTSILEAGELFASRMRMSRPLRQLWDARESCIKYDRGWSSGFGGSLVADVDEDVRSFDLDDDEAVPEDLELHKDKKTKDTPGSVYDLHETDDRNVQQRLDLTDAFYRGALPHLQSIIIVVLKILLANISATGGLSASSQPSPALPQFPSDRAVDESQLPNSNINLVKQLSNASGSAAPPQEEGLHDPFEALNSNRTREITSKAIAGMLLTMLKWFRFSHVLKYQFLTQLLLDSNYLPLALKYFAMQDVDRALDRKTDNERLGFFEFAREDAGILPVQFEAMDRNAPGLSRSPDTSEDEAQPPPIKRRNSAPSPTDSTSISTDASPPESPGPPRRPEVDELGYPTSAPPQQPLTTYSARFFFTTIAMLRVLQKITKGHSHRALLLVQYKSSTILRKALKIPQPALRLYTLKLFKSQVPYCGRKWRQANMRVITAIYVFCRMGLRDDWISGAGAVDEWVENALAMEQGWRGLTEWWHSKFYRSAMGLRDMAQEDEEDFFTRELERIGWAEQAIETFEGDEDQGGWALQPEGW